MLLLLLMMWLLLMVLLLMVLRLMVLLLMVLLLRVLLLMRMVLLLMRVLRLVLRVRVLRCLHRAPAGVALAVPRVGAVARLPAGGPRARAAAPAVPLLPRSARDRTHLLDSRTM